MPFRLLFWRRPRINVVEMHGLIAPRPGAVSAGTMAPLIDRAFRSARGLPVILDIESPGGSPVQSDLIASLIRRRADEQKVQVHAVIREVGASGGYWLACAADEIHANPMSIVGSIGVRGGGFGFPDMLTRFGIERRLYTAGANKARLDPFSPEKPEDVAFVQELLDALHERFKAWVRERRSGKLKGGETALFDGSFMLGQKALGSRADRRFLRCRQPRSPTRRGEGAGACSAPAPPRPAGPPAAHRDRCAARCCGGAELAVWSGTLTEPPQRQLVIATVANLGLRIDRAGSDLAVKRLD